MFTFSELFDLAIQVEVNGERFYRYAMNTVEGESLKNLLGWLADQELLHERAFKEIKERIVHGTKPVPSFASLTQQALRRAMGRHAFSLDELQIDSIRDEKEILEAAVVFEEDTIMFFAFIAPFVSDPGASSTLEKIKTEEVNHKQLLMEKISAI
ncbi:MAG: ferritin family protein [Syntrophobacteraceae bacterium]